MLCQVYCISTPFPKLMLCLTWTLKKSPPFQSLDSDAKRLVAKWRCSETTNDATVQMKCLSKVETSTHPHFSHIVLDCSQYNQHQQSSESDICYGSLGVPWNWGNRLKNKGFTMLKLILSTNTLKTRWELEPDASRNCFCGGYWGRTGQLLDIFFSVPSNSSRSLCES